MGLCQQHQLKQSERGAQHLSNRAWPRTKQLVIAICSLLKGYIVLGSSQRLYALHIDGTQLDLSSDGTLNKHKLELAASIIY